MAGPLDMRSGRPLSCATIIASVVLPSPGGPASRMWSGVRCCMRAASSSSCSCPRTFVLPDELGEAARPQRALERELGLGGEHGFSGADTVPILLQGHGHGDDAAYKEGGGRAGAV